MIDQTRLPEELTYLECTTPEEVADAIRRMAVRGAPAIGVAAAMGLALVAHHSRAASREALLKELEAAYRLLKGTRPTAVNLVWGLNRALAAFKESGGSLQEAREALIREAVQMAEEDLEVNRAIGAVGAQLLEDGDTVLTHCNAGALATVGYGTALGVVRAARERGLCIRVYATETRPALQGARLTAFELREDGIPVTVIPDTAVGYVMARGRIDKVVVGADRIVKSGHVFNKIGTYQVAVLAHRHRVPFYVAAPSSTFDLETPWEAVVIEERGYEEVVRIGGRRLVPTGVRIFNPAFDITPPELVSAIITDRGLLEPPLEASIAKAFRAELAATFSRDRSVKV